MQKNDLSFPNEFGVSHSHSTETALLMTENWLKTIKDCKILGTVIVTLRKLLNLLIMICCYKKCSHTVDSTMANH